MCLSFHAAVVCYVYMKYCLLNLKGAENLNVNECIGNYDLIVVI